MKGYKQWTLGKFFLPFLFVKTPKEELRMNKLNLSSCFILLPLILSNMICNADGAIMHPYLQCTDDANITAKVSFNSNVLRKLLNSLAANGPRNGGFYNTSAGNGSDKVYGLVQCRGDTSYSTCSVCAKDATRAASEVCTKSSDFLVWYPVCFVRYSYRSISGSLDFYASMTVYNETDLEDPANVTAGRKLMSEIAAMTSDQPLMFYTAEIGKMHGMAQCTRDLNKADCHTCLYGMLANYTFFIENKREWMIYGSRCSLWYRNDQLYVNASTSSGNTTNYSSFRATVSMLTTIVFLILLL